MLFLISNRKLVKDGSLTRVIKKCVNSDIDAIILREKDLPSDELFILAKEIKEIISDKKTLLIINNDIDVAKSTNADGYHIGFEKFINEKPLFNGLVGVSVHSLDEAIIAEQEGAGYLLASHIFETDCKKGLEPKGIKLIKDIKKKVKIPVIALGGINLDNINEVFEAGSNGVAVMSSIMKCNEPEVLTRKYKDIIKKLNIKNPFSIWN